MGAPRIVLRARDFNRDTRTGRAAWIESPAWISNGHWAMRRDRIDAIELEPLDPQKISDEQIVATVLRPKAVRKWVATEYKHGIARVFVAGKQKVGLQRRYLRLIKADRVGAVLYGATPSAPFRNARRPEDAWFVLMPMRPESIAS